MTTPTASPALSPLQLNAYFRDHAPAAARRGMRGYVLHLLITMARMRGPNTGMCWPSVEYIARMIGRSVRHVQRLLRELEALGEVERIEQRRADGGQSSNLYRLRGLISWARKNVTGGGDMRAGQTPKGKKSNPARGVKSGFRGAQAAPPRPAPPVTPVDRSGQALKKIAADGLPRSQRPCAALVARPAPSPAKWRHLTAAQVEEARTKCDPVQWQRLQLAAGLDGVASGDLDAAAAWRWRADAIMRGVI